MLSNTPGQIGLNLQYFLNILPVNNTSQHLLQKVVCWSWVLDQEQEFLNTDTLVDILNLLVLTFVHSNLCTAAGLEL